MKWKTGRTKIRVLYALDSKECSLLASLTVAIIVSITLKQILKSVLTSVSVHKLLGKLVSFRCQSVHLTCNFWPYHITLMCTLVKHSNKHSFNFIPKDKCWELLNTLLT